MKSTASFINVLLILAAVMACGCDTNGLSRADFALNNALECYDLVAAERALQAGANPNVRVGLSMLQKAVLSTNPALVELVLKAGADPNICPDDTQCLLTRGLYVAHSSSKRVNEDADRDAIVALLLRAGADPNGSPNDSLNPLEHAIDLGHTRIAMLLIEAGASPQGRVPKSGPLQTALRRSDHAIAKRLVAMGAKLDPDPALVEEIARSGDVESLEMALELTRKSSEGARNFGRALAAATMRNCIECVRLLLEAGAFQERERSSKWFESIGGADATVLGLYAAYGLDLRETDVDKSTLLHHAAKSGNAEGIKWFVTHGVPVDVCDIVRRTPLMIAAERGHTEAVRALLDAGANFALLDDEGRTAKVLAAQSQVRTKAHDEVEQLLHARGALEYTGKQLPPSKYDAEVADKEQYDVTGDFYAQLPFLKPSLRLFLTMLPRERSDLVPVDPFPDTPLPNDSSPSTVSRLYAVLPDRNVIKLERPDDVHTLGMQLRSPDDALTLVRFYDYPGPFLVSRLVASSVQFQTNMYIELPENDKNSCSSLSGWGGPLKPVVVRKTTADKLYYVVTRYMMDSARSPRSGRLDEILRVTERVRSNGAHSLESTKVLKKPGMFLQRCALR